MSTASLTRGICRECETSQKLRKDGNIGGHGGGCSGEGRKPKRSRSSRTSAKVQTIKVQTVSSVVKTLKKKKVKKKAKKKAKKRVRTTTNTSSGSVQQGTTYVAVVLDNSGSMHGLRAGACNAFNQLCEPIREQGDDYKTSYYVFGTRVQTKWMDRSPKNLPKLSMQTYQADGGMTALFDATGQAIEDFEAKGDPDACFLIIVITDGCENRSRAYSGPSLAKKIKQVQATDRWTFAFSVPKGYAKSLARILPIPAGNFQEWYQTDAGVRSMGDANRSAISRFTQQRASGQKSVTNFYVNVGRQSVASVQAKLEPVAPGQFRKLTVGGACKIREFVIDKNLTFFKGCAFYSLQKPETVQSYKEIVLERQDTGEMFSGPAVRNVIGIPVGENGRVKPGNLGEWIVWVQSTSNNRKLLGKQVILYKVS